MRLKTLVGAYAGEVRDYSFGAAVAALSTGTAAPLHGDVLPPRLQSVAPPSIARAGTARPKRARAKE